MTTQAKPQEHIELDDLAAELEGFYKLYEEKKPTSIEELEELATKYLEENERV